MLCRNGIEVKTGGLYVQKELEEFNENCMQQSDAIVKTILGVPLMFLNIEKIEQEDLELVPSSFFSVSAYYFLYA